MEGTTLSPIAAAVHPAAELLRPRRYLMCPPTRFAVVYTINPWMHPERPVDVVRAIRQWEALVAAYRAAGHTVELARPATRQPDMVFSANSALVVDGVALLARFRHPQRRGEERAYARWFRKNGFTVEQTAHVHEGEGDFVVMRDAILAGTGFRTDPEAHRDVERRFGREVVSLRLIDPRFYHLDTALFALDDEHIAYYPDAFDADSRAELRRRHPDAIVATARDALVFGCNSASDGVNVFMPAGADELAAAVAARGFRPVPIDLSELRKAGGSVKCCTLELRTAQEAS